MRNAKGLCVAVALLGLMGTVWAARQHERPADALEPENDRVAQLERRVADLEARLAQLERASTMTLPAQWTAPAAVAPPQPLPSPSEGEINGVKFRLFLIGNQQVQDSERFLPIQSAGPATPADPEIRSGGIVIRR